MAISRRYLSYEPDPITILILRSGLMKYTCILALINTFQRTYLCVPYNNVTDTRGPCPAPVVMTDRVILSHNVQFYSLLPTSYTASAGTTRQTDWVPNIPEPGPGATSPTIIHPNDINQAVTREQMFCIMSCPSTPNRHIILKIPEKKHKITSHACYLTCTSRACNKFCNLTAISFYIFGVFIMKS